MKWCWVAEQDRLVENYINEACSIKRHFLGNRTCDIRISPSRLEVPMVPCNFIPIQPQLYDGVYFTVFAFYR